MKRGFFALIFALITMSTMTSCSSYNNMVTMDEDVARAWADVETQYQRRADLIPNLVSTVKGYATHEQETLTEVTEARAKASSMRIDPNDLTKENMAAYQQAQGAVGSALGRLLAISESYPDLKASQSFMELQAQLEGTENRISVSRSEFNRVTREYNSSIRKFPANMIANFFDFDTKPYFEADAAAATAPKVEF